MDIFCSIWSVVWNTMNRSSHSELKGATRYRILLWFVTSISKMSSSKLSHMQWRCSTFTAWLGMTKAWFILLRQIYGVGYLYPTPYPVPYVVAWRVPPQKCNYTSWWFGLHELWFVGCVAWHFLSADRKCLFCRMDTHYICHCWAELAFV